VGPEEQQIVAADASGTEPFSIDAVSETYP
jgi:hypothetical protein